MFKKKKNAEKYFNQYLDLAKSQKQNVSTIKKLLKIMKCLLDNLDNFQNQGAERTNSGYMTDKSETPQLHHINWFLLNLIPSNLPKIPLRILTKIIHTEIKYTQILEPFRIMPLIEERKFRIKAHKDTLALVISILAFLVALAAIFIKNP